MLCSTTLLKNDSTESIIKYYDTISRTDYKYCVTVVLATPFIFTINQLINNKHPMTITYSSTNTTTQVLYNFEHILKPTTTVGKNKPINWKQQLERYRVALLLKATE